MLTEIISGIWIGNIQDSYNEEFYNDNLIDIVINCTIDYGFLDLPKLKKIRIPITSSIDPNNDLQLLKNNMVFFFLSVHGVTLPIGQARSSKLINGCD